MSLGTLFDKALAAMLPIVPRPIVRKVAWRYVAGESLDDAVACIKRLNAKGAMATLDVLGEEIASLDQSHEAVAAYLDALDAIEREGLDANISIKLTAFGQRLDEEVMHQGVVKVLERAIASKRFVRMDMEDSSTTSATLDYYRRLRKEGYGDEQVGVVLQAYMRRSRADVADLSALEASYRLCKGIYVEREEVAFKEFAEVRSNYLALLRQMFEAGSYVGIATHDHYLVDEAEDLIRELGLAKEQYEFQMLLGVDEPLVQRLIGAGHRLRIYVPYGKDWYAYSIRRLKENPRIGRYILMGMFKK
ncbi:MAG: proline dehydrogenase family protein [Planctomycetota bacterium]